MQARNTSRTLLVLVFSALLSGCEAYEPPPLPTVPTSPGASTVPTHIALNAGSRADDGIDVAATVLSEDEHGVPNVPVVFTIGAGTIQPPTAMTDQTGTAHVIAVSTAMTTISATIGGGVVSYVNVLDSVQPPQP